MTGGWYRRAERPETEGSLAARLGVRRRLGLVLPPALIVATLLVTWEVAAQVELIADALRLEPYLVPAPSDVAVALYEDRSLLASDGWVTLQEVVLGFLVALVLGFGFAVAMHLAEPVRRAFYPLVIASQTIPIIVVAPIFVVWFGFGIGPKLAIIALICFFPVCVNTLDGLRAVDPEMPRMMRTLDASRWRILTRVEIPAAAPYFFSGAKIAVAVAVIGAVFGEWAGSDAGLGHTMLQSTAQLLSARLFAAIVVLSAMAIALVSLVRFAERRLAWWGPGGKPR